jgi:hypothetical protein
MTRLSQKEDAWILENGLAADSGKGHDQVGGSVVHRGSSRSKDRDFLGV